MESTNSEGDFNEEDDTLPYFKQVLFFNKTNKKLKYASNIKTHYNLLYFSALRKRILYQIYISNIYQVFILYNLE